MGMDIRPDAIHLMQLKKSKRGLSISHLSTHPIAENFFYEGKIKHWQSFSLQLSSIVEAYSLEKRPVAIYLPLHLVRIDHLTLSSHLSEADIITEIHHWARKTLPGVSDALCVDFTVQQPIQSFDITVKFTIAREEYVTQYVNAVNAAGLEVKIVDIDLYALSRVAYFIWQAEKKRIKQELEITNEKKIIAVLHQIRDHAIFIILRNQEIVFYQNWNSEEPEDFFLQFENRLKIYSASYNETISTILFFGSNLYVDQLKAHPLSTVFHIIYPDLLEHMIYSSLSEPAFDSASWLIACGLAMRELPPW